MVPMPGGRVRSFALAALLGAVAVVWASAPVQLVELGDGSVASIDWSADGAVRVAGFGCAFGPDRDAGERRLSARRAAIVVAQRRLLEVLQGLSLYGGITLADAAHASDAVRMSIEGVVRGALVVAGSERWDHEGCATLAMVVPLSDLRRDVPQVPHVVADRDTAPLAFGERVVIERGGAVRLWVLANDVAWGGAVLSLERLGTAQHGALTAHPDGSVTYRHDGSAATDDAFVYRASDGEEVSNEALVRIAVLPPSGDPDGLEDVRVPSEPVLLEDLVPPVVDAPDAPDSAVPVDPVPPVADVPDEPVPEDAAPAVALTEALAEIRATVAEALRLEPIASPDRGLWRDALGLGERVVEEAPDDPTARLLLARTYSQVGWHSRAWEQWRAYLDLAGALYDPEPLAEEEASTASLFAGSGAALGYARYSDGRSEEALGYYRAVLEHLPDQQDALVWAARIHFEQGRVDAALPYWIRAAELAPDDAGIGYFLERTRQRLAVGVEASDAFHAGMEAYQEGRAEDALVGFEAAVTANDAFLDALVWAGRTSLELGLPERAQRHWAAVLTHDPHDERARYFHDRSVAQVRWGVPASNAFDAGQRAYREGDVALAAERFRSATLINPAYLQAWEWAARSNQELARFGEALVYWQGLVQREPEYPQALYNLRVVEQQVGRSPDAGRALGASMAAYQVADFDEAKARAVDAVTLDPEYTEAWAWLGRIHFVLAAYPEAAEGYEQAYALDPDNDDYRYFMEEARWLATQRS